METLKQLKATKMTLKERTMIVKREYSFLGTKGMFENIKDDKSKQMRSRRQIDMLEQ